MNQGLALSGLRSRSDPLMPDARPEADPAGVDRWVDAVATMDAETLGDFERSKRGHTSITR